MKFIKPSQVKRYIREHDRRVSAAFIQLLDDFVRSKIDEAVVQHNGGRRTLDAEVAAFVGIRPKFIAPPKTNEYPKGTEQ